MRILGITGGTGTGKSTVTEILRKKGCKVIDADRIAKEIERQGTPVFRQITEAFGKEVVDGKTGELDRKALSALVFSDGEKLRKLNAIVHKGVAKEIKKQVAVYRHRGEEYVVLDVPIPIEEGFFDTADVVWAVVANTDLRIERLMKRSGLTEEEAERRIASQMSCREYAELADVTIDNEGTTEELEQLVDYEFHRTVKVSSKE